MSERSLQISQIVALLTAAPLAAAYTALLILLKIEQPEIIYGMMFVILWVTGFCAAVAYVVSLILLLIYLIKDGSVGNRALSLSAVVLPAILFALMAVILFAIYPLSKARVEKLQEEKEMRLKEAYENKTIDIA